VIYLGYIASEKNQIQLVVPHLELSQFLEVLQIQSAGLYQAARKKKHTHTTFTIEHTLYLQHENHCSLFIQRNPTTIKEAVIRHPDLKNRNALCFCLFFFFSSAIGFRTKTFERLDRLP